jgi:hypothetical protein
MGLFKNVSNYMFDIIQPNFEILIHSQATVNTPSTWDWDYETCCSTSWFCSLNLTQGSNCELDLTNTFAYL